MRDPLPDIYALARRRSLHLGALLHACCEATIYCGNTIVFGFKFETHANRARGFSSMLEVVSSEVVGYPVHVEIVHDAEVVGWQYLSAEAVLDEAEVILREGRRT